MSPVEARMQLEAAIKPFRPLLDLAAVLDAAIEAGNFLASVDAQMAAAKATLDEARAAQASAQREAETLRTNAEREAAEIRELAHAYRAEQAAAADATKHALEADSAAKLADANARLAEVEAAIVDATAKLDAERNAYASLIAEGAGLKDRLVDAMRTIERAERIKKASQE